MRHMSVMHLMFWDFITSSMLYLLFGSIDCSPNTPVQVTHHVIDTPSSQVRPAPSHLSLLKNDGRSLNLVPSGGVSQDGLGLLQSALGNQPAWGLGDEPMGNSRVKGHCQAAVVMWRFMAAETDHHRGMLTTDVIDRTARRVLHSLIP